MSASWEEYYGTVLVVTLTRETVTTAWASNYRSLQIHKGMSCFITGMPFGMARNIGCQKLLERGWEYIFFLDDDTLVPPDTVLRLMSHKKDIVSGLYYRRYPPLVPCMMRELPNGKNQWITDYKKPDLMEVDFAGSGCLLIHRDVLLNLPPVSTQSHWFEWRVDRMDLPEEDRLSEDFTFMKHARKHGFKIFVDTSIQCAHATLAKSILPGKLEPLNIGGD